MLSALRDDDFVKKAVSVLGIAVEVTAMRICAQGLRSSSQILLLFLRQYSERSCDYSAGNRSSKTGCCQKFQAWPQPRGFFSESRSDF
jgi:hypothetical protein